MAPRGPVFPSASLGALLIAEIASAGRTGPSTPASIVWMPHHDSMTSPRDTAHPTIASAALHTRHPAAMLCAVPSQQHRDSLRHSPARSPHHLRDTLSNPRAIPAPAIRNINCNIRAITSPYPRMLLRSNVRITSARLSPVRPLTCALLVPVCSHYGAGLVLDDAHCQALCLRCSCTDRARSSHSSSAVAPHALAHVSRQTRAIVVAYRRECDAILAPMNPPQLPHTRATHPHTARSTGATAANALSRGGRS